MKKHLSFPIRTIILIYRNAAGKDTKDASSEINGHQAMLQSEKIAFAAAAAMHAAANSAAVAAATGGNLADYLWTPPPTMPGPGIIPHPLSLQHLRPPHTNPVMSPFSTGASNAQLQPATHLPFSTNPFFWHKRPFDAPTDTLIGKIANIFCCSKYYHNLPIGFENQSSLLCSNFRVCFGCCRCRSYDNE